MAGDPVAARRAEESSQFYIPATRNLHDGRLRTLKHGDSFALLDRHGDVVAGPSGVLGLYHRDTRHLSRFELQGEGWRPLLLSSNVQAPITLLAADLANPEIQHGDRWRWKATWSISCAPPSSITASFTSAC
jgi:glycogen debranching enzyme